MLVRIWKTTFDTNAKQRLIDYANQVSLPVLSSRPGNQAVLFYSQGDEWVTFTVWDNEEAVKKLATDPEYARITDGLMDLNVLGSKQDVSVFEYHGGEVNPALFAD